jgi:hypothetical protein
MAQKKATFKLMALTKMVDDRVYEGCTSTAVLMKRWASSMRSAMQQIVP